MTALAAHYTPEHHMFRDTCRRFFEKEVTPFHMKWEEEGMVPRELWRKAGAQGLLGEDDAEPEGRVGRVALEDREVVPRLLHQDREVQARRTGTDDAHLHASTSASRSNCPMSATVGKRISSSQPASS